MKLKHTLDKIHETYKPRIVTTFKRALAVSGDAPGTLDSLETVYSLLGRAVIRRDLLMLVQKRINDALNISFGFKVDEIQEFIKLCDSQIELLNKAAMYFLAKEVPNVKAADIKGVDVPVEQR